MDDMSTEELQGLVEEAEDNGAWVAIEWSDESVNLDGEFTVKQLEAIVALKRRGAKCSE